MFFTSVLNSLTRNAQVQLGYRKLNIYSFNKVNFNALWKRNRHFKSKAHQRIHEHLHDHFHNHFKNNMVDGKYKYSKQIEPWLDSLHLFSNPNPKPFKFLLTAISLICIVVLAYIGYYLEKAPVTGRLRYMNIDPKVEFNLGIDELHEYIESFRDCIVPKNHSRYRTVDRIAKELIKETDLQHLHWEIYVIDDDRIANAFVMPNGKIFVFSGIFQSTCTDEGIAALLSHEIGHVIARHSAERHSWYQLMDTTLYPVTFILGLTFADEFFQWLATELVSISVVTFGILLPLSRDQELEADHIGMMLLSKACYDPKEAIEFHKRLGETEDPEDNIEYLNTHPLAKTRIDKLEHAMPRAKHLWSNSKCDKMWTLKRMFDKVTNYRFF